VMQQMPPASAVWRNKKLGSDHLYLKIVI